MSGHEPGFRFSSWISPWPLLAGVIVSFLGFSVAGRYESRHNLFRNFVRFHNYISIETLFYPTFAELRELARSQAAPRKVLVLIGGNSVFYGIGQSPEKLWTRHLQELLGPEFIVLNLAFRGGLATEGAALVMERLLRDGVPVVHVGVHVAGVEFLPAGANYRFLYLDAHYKGELMDDPARDGALKSGVFTAEQRLGSRIDSAIYFNEFWNRVGYNHVFTLWTPLTSGTFARGRVRYSDSDGNGDAVPLLGRYGPGLRENEQYVKGLFSAYYARNGAGDWVFNAERWKKFNQSISTAFPLPVRSHTLVVIPQESPFFLRRLKPDERALYDRIGEQTEGSLRDAGLHAVLVRGGFTEWDYLDRVHMVASGGAKVAARIAPEIREMARSLGYLKPEGAPN